jgi:Protein of unknown function (DUF4232)
VTRTPRLTGVAVGIAVLATSAACTTSGHPAADVTSASVPSSTAPSSPSSLPSETASTPPAVSTPASTSASLASSSPVAVTTTAAPRSTCTTVTVRVIRGSASLGQEIAALQFTNEGTRSCVLVGFPTVTLLRRGQQLGNASQPSTPGATSKRTLAPGDVAESVLHDYTQTCNSPLSDSLRVIVPGSTTTAIRPAEMRGCILRVDRLGPPQ